MKKSLIGMSKFLSLVLRHEPERIGIELDDEGWTDIEELISRANTYQKAEGYTPLTRELIEEIVETNNKKRFKMSDDGWMIRASQGHSLKTVDLKLEAVEPPEFLYHGTAKRHVASIMKNGLDKRARNHVHMNDDPEQSKKVGQRHGVPQVLRIKASAMEKDGYDFFLSANKVWLTDEVPFQYIEDNWEMDD